MKRIILVAGGNLDGNIHDLYYSMPIMILLREELEEAKEERSIEIDIRTVETVLDLKSLLHDMRDGWLEDEIYAILLTAGLRGHISEILTANESVRIIFFTADPSLFAGPYIQKNVKICVKSCDLSELYGMLGLR